MTLAMSGISALNDNDYLSLYSSTNNDFKLYYNAVLNIKYIRMYLVLYIEADIPSWTSITLYSVDYAYRSLAGQVKYFGYDNNTNTTPMTSIWGTSICFYTEGKLSAGQKTQANLMVMYV